MKSNNFTSAPLQLSIFPNPANGWTTFSYYLPVPQKVRLDILTAQGQILTTLAYDIFLSSGTNQIYYDLTRFSPGVYFVSLKGEEKSVVKSLLILK